MTKVLEPEVTIGLALGSGEDPIPEELLPVDSDSVEFVFGEDSAMWTGFPETPLGVADKFTVSMWVKRLTDDTSSAYRLFSFANTGFIGGLVTARQTSGAPRLMAGQVVGDSGANLYADTSATSPWLTLDNWVHLTWVFNHTNGVGGTTQLYRNGIADGSWIASSGGASPTVVDSNRVLSISGGIAFSGDVIVDEPLNGFRVFDMGVWNTALSAAEALSLFNEGLPANYSENFGNYTSAATLRHYYRLAYNLKPQIGRTLGFDDGNLPLPVDTIEGGALVTVTDSPGR